MASSETGDTMEPTLDEADRVQGKRLGAPDPAAEDDVPTVEPPVRGMGWVSNEGAERMGLRTVPDEDEGQPEDTSAYHRRNPDKDDQKAIVPKPPPLPPSSAEGAAIPVALGVDTTVRRPAPPADPPPGPPEPTPIPRVTILSSPGKGQVCPTCKGALRAIRTVQEPRLECTWFRLEWLEVERDWADCPKHLTVETVPLVRPAFALPDGPMANGLLARIATWRWQDHMPGHEITRLLAGLGLRCTDTHTARFLQAGAQILAPVAAAIRDRTSSGKTDTLGLLVVESGAEGRMRATTKGDLVSFAWQPSDDGPRPDDASERARHVLLDARGWSRAGRQAMLRRQIARGLPTDRDRAARASWRLEELRTAPDRATEELALTRLTALLGDLALLPPELRAPARTLQVEGTEGFHRFGPDGKPSPPPDRPENIRAVLPRWFLSAGDGGVQAVADWLTIVESCKGTGLAPWRYLRDLFEAWADDGRQLDPAKWMPDKRH